MLSQRKSFFACRTFWRNRPRKKSLFGAESIPQRLKPNSLQSIYVRAEASTLQRPEFFRSLEGRALIQNLSFSQPGRPLRPGPIAEPRADRLRVQGIRS